jgi:tetratricopeptide (TPR) repeat protein
MIRTIRIVILYSLLHFVFFPSFSQRVNFDQLKKDVLEAQNNREKATALMILGSSFSPREANITFSYADSILLIAVSDDSAYYEHASTYLKAVGSYRKGDLINAKSLFKQSYDYFAAVDEEIASKCLNFIGIIHLRTHAADSAVIVFNQILQNSNVSTARLSAHGNIGRAYRQLGNYEEAINNFEQCVNLDSTNRFSILNSYMSIASIFVDMEFYDRGIEMLKKADISDLPQQPILAAYYNNLGEMYFQNEQYDSAIKYLGKGFEVAKSLRQNQLTLKNRLIISEIYLLKNRMDTSLALLKAVENDLHYYPAPPVLIDYNWRSANYFSANKEYDSVIYYAQKVLAITKTNHLEHQTKNSYELIAQSYEAKGNADSSAFYYKKHGAFVDESVISDKEKFAQDAKARYLLAQKEKEIDAKNMESSKLVLWKKILLGLLVLIGLISIYILLKLRKSKSVAEAQMFQNKVLSDEIVKNKNEIIELKSKAILPIEDIVSIKADGHYLEFNLISKSTPEVDRNQIKAVLSSLPSKFVQIHRSYVVNVEHIKIKQATKVVLKDGSELPVSRTFKNALNDAMNLN